MLSFALDGKFLIVIAWFLVMELAILLQQKRPLKLVLSISSKKYLCRYHNARLIEKSEFVNILFFTNGVLC